MDSNLRGFANLKLSDLQGLKTKWGEEKLRDRLLKYNLQNP